MDKLRSSFCFKDLNSISNWYYKLTLIEKPYYPVYQKSFVTNLGGKIIKLNFTKENYPVIELI